MADRVETKVIFAARDFAGAVAEAAQTIRAGGVVVFPTETVYGLGADATSPAAVQKIFDAKGRPQDNPLIVHIADLPMLDSVAAEVSPCAKKMIGAFWPGPLSLVLKKSGLVPDAVSAGLDTVAVRMPQNELARAVIRAAGVPVAAPSANVSGRPSPTLAAHAFEDLAGKVPLIIDGGPCGVGVESTVVDATGDIPVVLRPGGVTPEMIRDVCGGVEVFAGNSTGRPASPGMKYRHYAPRARVIVYAGGKKTVAKNINSMYDIVNERGGKAVIFCADDCAALYGGRDARTLGRTAEEAQAALFAELRRADENGYGAILFHLTDEMGLAVKNRIEKAAGNTAGEEKTKK